MQHTKNRFIGSLFNDLLKCHSRKLTKANISSTQLFALGTGGNVCVPIFVAISVVVSFVRPGKVLGEFVIRL